MATQHDATQQDRTPHGDASGELLTSTATTEPAARGGRGRTLAVVGSAALLVLVAGAVYVGQRGQDAAVTVTDHGAPSAGGGVQPGAMPADPTPGLHVTVAGPTSVRAGQAATYTVSWTDDDGTFVGSTQDWGDTGDGSSKQGRCASTARVPGTGSFTATHTWTKAGTYAVKLTVTTQACSTGTAVEEAASATTTVVVVAG